MRNGVARMRRVRELYRPTCVFWDSPNMFKHCSCWNIDVCWRLMYPRS
jgi:hypothetical protein